LNGKYELGSVSSEETEFFYSSQLLERDREIGCIGHLRADFGRNGNEFWNTWENHFTDYKTQDFKDEFDSVINSLRDKGILKNRSAMSAHCGKHPEAKLADGRDNNYGFKIKTDSHVYYLRCNASQGDYNLYCYAYDRSRLEKAMPSLAETKTTLAERLEKGKRKASQHEKPDNTQKNKKREGIE